MATARFSPQKKARGPMTLLAGAICEWVLVFLIFVDAAFSHVLRRFAEYCELPTPCILCSRIDTPSGKRKQEYYNALFCRSHKEEISSLASCHAHGKLTDVRELCEECYMPMYDKLNSGSYIVGKLEKDFEKHSVQSLVLHKKNFPNSSAPRICSCCNRSWGENSNAQTFLQLTPAGMGASKANVKPPLPRVQRRSCFSRKNSYTKLSETPASPQFEGESLGEALSHVGYTEIKFSSDTESEVIFSDEEGSVISVLGKIDTNQEHDRLYVAEPLLELQTDDSVLEKHSNQSFEEVTSLLDQHMQLETHKPIPAHGLQELSWEKPHPKTDIAVKSHGEDDTTLARESINPTVLTYGDVPYFLNEIRSTNSSAMTDEGNEVFNTSVEPPSPTGSPKFEDALSVIQQSALEQDDFLDVDESSSDLKHVKALASLERNDSSLKLKERVSLPGVSTNFEDNKSVLQQSALEQDEIQNIDDSSSDGNHVQDLPSLERNDSSLKFEERVSLSDVEGETSIDMLKSQIEYARKCMNDLYKELEEERHASAIGANEAMAMITRLQEEKAQLHVEALQYLRMMDEQAEYDMEALQKANDDLTEKEKDLQDLEYELELYRNNTRGGSPIHDLHNQKTQL